MIIKAKCKVFLINYLQYYVSANWTNAFEHACSILGGIFLTVGLYSVMWGKNKDYVKSQLPAENLQESRDASFG